MKTLIKFAVACTILGAGCANTAGQAYKPGDYRGTIDSFSDFVSRYSLPDWPVPSEIRYFDPSGGKAETIRYAHWIPTQANRSGVVVHFNGRTEFIERNVYTYRDLLQRGFEVWSMDWRGQGFSARQVSEKQKHSIDTFATYVADATYFVKNVVKLDQQSGKKILLAHSMGGQIALRLLLEEEGSKLFDYAVLSSPLLRIPDDSWYLRLANKAKVSTFFGDSCVLGKSATWASDLEPNTSCSVIKDGLTGKLVDPDDARNYSNDMKKLAETNCLVESSRDSKGKIEPDLRVACPTSNWLNAAFQSTDLVMETAEKLTTPTLIVRAKPDRAVDNTGQTDFCSKARIRCEDIGIVNKTQTGHELLIELQPIRELFFKHFDAFVGLTK